MKGKFLAVLAAAGAIAVAISSAPTPASAHHVAINGNNLPHITGPTEKLKLYAYDNCPDQEYEGTERNSIRLQANFGTIGGNHEADTLNLVKTNDVFLFNASTLGVDEFTVLDGNACPNASDDGAAFALPGDISTNWYAMFMLTGQPGTQIDIATCWTDNNTNTIVCGDSVVRTRGGGKPTASNVTNELLKPIDYALSPFWESFTNGNVKATIYFYPCSQISQC